MNKLDQRDSKDSVGSGASEVQRQGYIRTRKKTTTEEGRR